jgi:hypothetical protein
MRRVLSLVLIWCLIPHTQGLGSGTNRLVVTYFILGRLSFLRQCKRLMDSLYSGSMEGASCCDSRA